MFEIIFIFNKDWCPDFIVQYNNIVLWRNNNIVLIHKTQLENKLWHVNKCLL